VNVDHNGVEQAFMPAYSAINCGALAAEVSLGGTVTPKLL
jgi:hypothetical protein